tara:strand:+ start:74 stop:1018 length:945 start_codon:yes stop_codon:yes gene_type:complete
MSFKVDSSTIIDNNQDYTFQGGTFTGTLTSNGGFNWGDVPVGLMHWWVKSNVSDLPSNWLHCNGQAISRTTYSDLFAVIGTTYGSGNGSTTFNLPDTRNHYIMGDVSGSVGAGPHAPKISNHSHPSNTLGQAVNIPHTHTATSGGANSPHTHSANTSNASNAPHTHNAATSAANMPHSHNGSTGNNGSHTHAAGTVPTSEVEASPAGNQNYAAKNVSQLIPEGTRPAGGHSHPVAGTGANAPHGHILPWSGNAPHGHTANINQSNAPHSHSLSVSDANAPHVHNTDVTNNNPVSASNSGVELHSYLMRLIIKVT